jgi:pyruvate carboxylase
MGLWDRWEEVLDAYRDVNKLLGDIIKVTPSSKCVGDLALYLVTRNVNAADLLDPAKAASIDFPDSVVGLLKGELGFPHRGFPNAVEVAILKGAPKLTIRAGLALPPIDFQENISTLSKKFQLDITPEQGMSSIMYPKVFSDYMTRLKAKSRLLRYLPTPVYFYAMEPGQKFTMTVPSSLAREAINDFTSSADNTDITIELRRVGPLKGGKRTIVFSVNGMEQSTDIRDSAGEFVFEGPMAEIGKVNHIASPMPGAIEKLLVKEGQKVNQGDTLCTVSAMKMEVKVTSPIDGTIKSLSVSIGTRVIEGALLMEM